MCDHVAVPATLVATAIVGTLVGWHARAALVYLRRPDHRRAPAPPRHRRAPAPHQPARYALPRQVDHDDDPDPAVLELMHRMDHPHDLHR